MKLKALIVLAAVLSLAAKYKLETTTDEFTGHTYHAMDGNRLGCKDILGQVDLDAQKFVPKGGDDETFQLFVHYRSGDWLFIKERVPSLLLLIDGKTTELTPENEVRRNSGSGGWVTESAMYEVEPELLIALAGAKEVKVRIRGDKYPLERCFSEDNFAHFKDFVAQFVTPAPEKAP